MFGPRQFARHGEGRRQGHHRVEADVILAAKRACVGQGGRGHNLLEVRALLYLVHDDRQQLGGRCFLHQANERLQLAEIQGGGLLGGKSRVDAQVAGQGRADAGHQHALADRPPENHDVFVESWSCPREERVSPPVSSPAGRRCSG